MALTTPERSRVFAYLMRIAPWTGLLKADLLAAVNAADDWADANASSYNLALPQPFRGVASASQKALLLAAICLKRTGLTRLEERD